MTGPAATGAAGRPWRLGTRASTLAMTQSRLVADLVTRLTGRPVELVRIRTEGDVNTGPLATIGGTGVFVGAVRAALLSGEVDLVVHSAKDLPAGPADGITLAAVPVREDPVDVLCANGLTIAELPPGAQIGTGSPRRAAQLRALRSDLRPVAIRGNIDTRLGLVGRGELAGVVLAKAGLARLDRLAEVSEELTGMLPAPAQGALAIERATDAPAELADGLAALDDAASHAEIDAERQVLASLQAGCSAPIGARARCVEDRLELVAGVFADDGRQVRLVRHGPAGQASEVGRQMAQALAAEGAGALMGRP